VGFHNQSEKQQIEAILAVLPYGHAARAAFRCGADALMLQLLVERHDLGARLEQVWYDAYLRRRAK
jgi:hypothetical protein